MTMENIFQLLKLMMDYQIVAGIDIPVSMSKNQLKELRVLILTEGKFEYQSQTKEDKKMNHLFLTEIKKRKENLEKNTISLN